MSGGKHTKQKRISFLTVLTVALAVVFLISGGMVATQLLREKRENDAFKALSQRIPPRRDLVRPAPTEPEDPETPTSRPPDTPEEPTAPELTAAELYGELFSENADMFGWICVEGTKINYPVMYTPKDPEFYLRRGFDRAYSYSGTPFLDGNCFDGCGNYIIYGHHMKNGTMFAAITDYAGEEFWKEHPIIYFDTMDEMGEYEVLAAFYAKVYNEDDNNAFRFYNYTDLTDEAVFEEYLKRVYDAALYNTGVTARYGDQLLTLTTCSYHTTDGRFVVVARKKSA